jgi:hypothetical protein
VAGRDRSDRRRDVVCTADRGHDAVACDSAGRGCLAGLDSDADGVPAKLAVRDLIPAPLPFDPPALLTSPQRFFAA